ncbi:hypothetical protein [Pseudazoarcus pumilus]|nr:hypothetical protein [Pseudazoarcus pumilus]
MVAMLLASCAFLLVGEGRAEMAAMPVASAMPSDSVQDRHHHDPLDLKIFVHRHGLLMHAQDGAPQGRANTDLQRVGS